MTAKLLATIGTVMQAVGTLAIGLSIWRRADYFDTSGGFIDEKGRWPNYVKWGFWIYMIGYIPLLWAIWIA